VGSRGTASANSSLRCSLSPKTAVDNFTRRRLNGYLYDAEEHEAVFTRPAPPAFVAVVSKAIAKSRERRYRRIEDFLRELDACGAAPDDTERTILAVPSLTERAQAESTGDDLRAIEAQIRRLEEERQKRLVLAVQGQAQEARERAARAGAV
jgi:hypothetical protein